MSFCVLFFVSLLRVAVCGWDAPLEASAKISPEVRQQMGEKAAVNSQRAYAPAKGRVAKFLALEAHVGKVCLQCGDKDYSDMCPLGWTELSDGWCAAPSSYEGVCEKDQNFIGVSVAARMEVEVACAICWPCSRHGEDKTSTCERDWARPCPNGYTPQDIPYNEFRETGGVTCAADFFYEGRCEPQVLFKDTQAKIEFAERCQTSWPCRRTCKDALAACPDGWQSVGGGLCLAPDSYKAEGCPLIQSFLGWTIDMKSDFAQKCGVAWLCAKAFQEEAEQCQQLDLSSCPRRWVAKDGGRCEPPPDAQGGCAEAELMDFSVEQKLAFAVECSVEWPCMGETTVDISAVPRAPARVETEQGGPIDVAGHVVEP